MISATTLAVKQCRFSLGSHSDEILGVQFLCHIEKTQPCSRCPGSLDLTVFPSPLQCYCLSFGHRDCVLDISISVGLILADIYWTSHGQLFAIFEPAN